MEKRKAYILVEGIADKHFLEEYILHLGYEDKDFEINAVNGWCNLKNFTSFNQPDSSVYKKYH